jgi:hypothetical protein
MPFIGGAKSAPGAPTRAKAKPGDADEEEDDDVKPVVVEDVVDAADAADERRCAARLAEPDRWSCWRCPSSGD